MSAGVGNGGVWENHLCTGDLHGTGVVGAREKLSVAGVRPGEKGRSLWGVGGYRRLAFKDASNPCFFLREAVSDPSLGSFSLSSAHPQCLFVTTVLGIGIALLVPSPRRQRLNK